VIGRALRLVHQAGPPDRLLQRGPDRGVERGQGIGQGGGADPGGGEIHPVEAEGVVPDRGPAAEPHVLADRPDLSQRGLDVKRRPGQHPGELLPAQRRRRLPAKIDPGKHPTSLWSERACPGRHRRSGRPAW
jgi:hypothetical protein